MCTLLEHIDDRSIESLKTAQFKQIPSDCLCCNSNHKLLKYEDTMIR